MQSDYMHWFKLQKPVRYNLSSSEVPHFRLDGMPLAIADLDLDGASHPRYAPLRQAIGKRYGVDADRSRHRERCVDGQLPRLGDTGRTGRRSDLRTACLRSDDFRSALRRRDIVRMNRVAEMDFDWTWTNSMELPAREPV
jgi:hypothetical protein